MKVQNLRTSLVGTLALSFALAGGLLAQGQQGTPPASSQGQQGSQAQPGAPSQPSQPGAQAQPAAPAMSPEEMTALQTIQREFQTQLNPDKVIQLVTDFETKYPNDPYLYFVDFAGAASYQQKNNVAKAIEYGQKSVKAKPDFIMSWIIVADLLPTPQSLNLNPADKDKKLAEAETDANKALELIAQMTKQQNETDEQLKKRKDALDAEMYSALGMIHLERASAGLTGPDKDELAKAEDNYQKAVAAASDRVNPGDFFRLGEAYSMDGKIDQAIDAFSKASQAGQGGPIQTMADQKVQELKQKKGGAAQAPPKP